MKTLEERFIKAKKTIKKNIELFLEMKKIALDLADKYHEKESIDKIKKLTNTLKE